MADDAPPGLDLGALTSWLAAHVPAFDGSSPPEARLLAGGRSNLTYEVVDAAGQHFALRRPPLGHIMPKAHDMAREHRVLEGLGTVGFPVPAVHALCEDSDVLGAPFMLMDFVDGRVIADRSDAGGLTPEQAGDVSRALVEGLASLHSVDVRAAGLADFGRPEGYLQRQVALWGRQWSITKTRDLTDINDLARWLDEHARELPPSPTTSLVHGDYRLDNVILDPGLRRLRAVLDWEMATLGDPVADLAVTLVYWTEPGDGLRRAVPVAQDVTSGAGFWDRERLVAEYRARTGLDLGHLTFAVALACYKLAVIMESIHFRSLAGQQRGAALQHQEDMGAATEGLASLGLEVVRRGTLEGLRA
jgi:aminoglycoside phosphotransferase (APT) family kinase protein